jgi:lipoprotein-anchoring transpeptidase ErfK/SrfK
MTQVEEQAGVAPPVARRRSTARRPNLVTALVAVLLAVVVIVAVQARGGSPASTPSLTTSAADLEPAASTTPTPRPATTTGSTAVPTTVAPVTVPPTSAVVVTPPTETTIDPGVRPAPLGLPIDDLTPSLGTPGTSTVASAASATVSVYAEPLVSPAPAFADWQFDAATQFGSRTVFLVTATSGDWLRVRLPMKPNGIEGWVHSSEVTLAPNSRWLVVDIPNRMVSLYDGDALLAQSTSVVGKDSTPTPTGTFYVTDLIRMEDPSTAYGPYVLALSARSDAFDFFNGGEPIVALHGTNQPSLLGSAASNGCVRLPNEVATELARMTPLGTPVFII